MTKGQLLCNYIEDNTNLLEDKKEFSRKVYNHMGATIVDSVLQAGLNYNSVVYPRIKRLVTYYPCYSTTIDFLILINTIPLREIILFRNPNKLWRIFCMAWLFNNNGVQTEIDAALWLHNKKNEQKLLSLKGIGNKTVDYLKGLVGISDAIAIDRHLLGFLNLAGIEFCDYKEAQNVYMEAATILDVAPYWLDKIIWNYMVAKKNI